MVICNIVLGEGISNLDCIFKKLLYIVAGYGIVHVLAQDLGILELDEKKKKFFKKIYVQSLLLYSAAYIVTDDYYLALFVVLLYYISCC